ALRMQGRYREAFDTFYKASWSAAWQDAAYFELARLASRAGRPDEAIELAERAFSRNARHHQARHLKIALLRRQGQMPAARAAARPPDYCFPNRLEDVLALEAAMRLNPADARAPYYLGDFWYAHRRYAEAIACWEQSRALDGHFATVHRNLGLAYYNKLSDPQRALQSFETAF